jgi:enoyl-CoA hydratase/carnithine racemase
MSMVTASVDGRLARLRLTRPGKRNALSHALVGQAEEAIADFGLAGAAVGILEAEGDFFCAGNDLAEAYDDPAASASADFLTALVTQPVLWVAAITGPALGSGVAVACVCPFVVISDDAWLALPEVQRVGAYPSVVQSYLELFTGPRAALDMCLTGRRVPATEAVRLGLATEAAPAEAVRSRAAELARQLTVTSPRVITAARESWQGQFRTDQFLARQDELDKVFRRQLPELLGAAAADPADASGVARVQVSAQPGEPSASATIAGD